MWRSSLAVAGGLAVMIVNASGASAAGMHVIQPSTDRGLIQRVHSVYEAEESLHRRGFYDVRLERASLPYSFNACKRGIRYHIHVNYYGELVEVDPIGPCARDDYGPGYGRPRYYDRYRYRY